jgi:hypothetical protein
MEENRGEDRRLPELIRLSIRPAKCPEDKPGSGIGRQSFHIFI